MFELLDIKWGNPTIGTPSGTINWEDDLSGLPTSSGSSTGQLIAALGNAFASWESVAAIDFAEGGAIDLRITYASFSTDGYSGNDGAAATASWSGTGQPSNAQIEFNSDLTWAPYGGGGIDFYAVALHEIGHIIGLDHVNDTSEIMNPIISTDVLGDGDIAGARYLYGTDGGDVPGTGVSGGGGGGDGGGGGGGGAIGLVVGLLALIFGMFSGGAGAAAVVAAGRVASETDDDGSNDVANNDQQYDDDYDIAADGTVTHVTFLPDLPMIDFGPPPNYDNEDEFEDSFFI